MQILSRHHAQLFDVLGKQSGRNIDKLATIKSKGFGITRATKLGLPILADCIGAMDLRIAEGPFPAGDHAVVLCNIDDWVTLNEIDCLQPQGHPEALYTGTLRSLGLM